MIPKPQKNSQGKVSGDFYPLQKPELVALRKAKLINNAAFVHLALRFENPYCDRPIQVIPKEFALRWQIPESSVYEAIAKLKEAKAIEIKGGKVVIEWMTGDSQQANDSENPESFWESRDASENPENILNSQNIFRDPRINSETSEKQLLKPLPNRASSAPQTIQTNTYSTDNSVVEEKVVEPDETELRETYSDVSQLGVKTNPTVRKVIKEHYSQVRDAIAHIRERISKGEHFRNLEGAFVRACMDGAVPESRASPPKKYPEPTAEQLSQLANRGNLTTTRLNEPGYPEVIAVDVGRKVVPWWEAIAI